VRPALFSLGSAPCNRRSPNSPEVVDDELEVDRLAARQFFEIDVQVVLSVEFDRVGLDPDVVLDLGIGLGQLA